MFDKFQTILVGIVCIGLIVFTGAMFFMKFLDGISENWVGFFFVIFVLIPFVYAANSFYKKIASTPNDDDDGKTYSKKILRNRILAIVITAATVVILFILSNALNMYFDNN
jgi:heme/copper-type cytochrome/quinol oxidase subunit 2